MCSSDLEVGSVTRNIDFETRDAAVGTQARFLRLLDRRELAAVAAASSTRLQTAIHRRETARLERFARRRGLLLEIRGRLYGRRLRNAVTAHVQLVSSGQAIGSVIAQLPVDSATLQRVTAPHAPGVQLAFTGLSGGESMPSGRGVTLPLSGHFGIRGYLPRQLEASRTRAAYVRVAEAGLLAVLALMLLTFVLARPLLRAFRWTEEQASEARVDSLTGLANRRALEETLAHEIARAQRFKHPLGIVLLDLDRFKEINDSFGHAAGDLMLRTVSRLLTSLARQADTVARWGGEEFVVVLPETDLDGARHFAERLRLAIHGSPVGEMRTSASCGVATMLPGDTVEAMLGAADQALYLAKAKGRNRTESASRNSAPAVA